MTCGRNKPFSRVHSGYGLGQWENALHSNASSHWLIPYPEWLLYMAGNLSTVCRRMILNRPIIHGTRWYRLKKRGLLEYDMQIGLFFDWNTWPFVDMCLPDCSKSFFVPGTNKMGILAFYIPMLELFQISSFYVNKIKLVNVIALTICYYKRHWCSTSILSIKIISMWWYQSTLLY